MKKIWLYILCVVVWVVVIACSYYGIKWNIVQDKIYSYLETYGYTEDDIERVGLNLKFSWKNEWQIVVEFKKEPKILYWFTYRNHEIIKDWVAAAKIPHKEFIEYENMFENGELKYNSENERYIPLEERTKALVENPRERANKEDVHQRERLKTLDSWIWNFPYWHFSSKNLDNNLISFESDSEDWTINRFAIYDRDNHKWVFDCFDWWWGGYIEVDEYINIDKINVNSCKEKYDEVVNYLKNWILVLEDENMNTDNVINLKFWNKTFDVVLEDNIATKALIEKLQEWDVIVNAREYWWFEKVGNLWFDLPRTDKQITTEPGDLVLYQWNQVSLFYDSNSWSYTKLWKVQMNSKENLEEILWNWDVTLTFSLK